MALISRTAELPGTQRAILAARFWTRTTVAAMGWNGDMLHAVEVVSRLVANGVRHGLPARAPAEERRLSLTASLTGRRHHGLRCPRPGTSLP
ncbi:hypothetical protein [Streptomyces sp. BK340]|uniref:hypothetical protein n=1 Tax=Streptomyces sp. BK340 TaxID=2572903 RepID=UPI0011AA4C7F|nr:hypothetical protein [Streptomyces sp. BK340]